MRTIEEELAAAGGAIREAADRRRLPPWRKPLDRAIVRTVLAAAVLVAAIAVPALWLRDSDPVRTEGQPAGFGTWETLAEAPITPRPHAVSVWTGSEAVFWAGSNHSRGFAYTDGAAYDPLTGTWRTIPVPGWGHPGLTGVWFDGNLYALAKGGGTRFEPIAGTWTDLPGVDGMYLATTVATDEAVWGLGPGSLDPGGQTDVAIARYDPDTNTWVYGPVFEGTPEIGSMFVDPLSIDQPTLWTGTDIVLWNPEGGGVTFNPTTETWQPIPALQPESGAVVASKATVAGSELVVLAELDTGGAHHIAVARHRDGTWAWQDLAIDLGDLSQATVAPAGDWLLVFAPDHDPLIMHVPSGAWSLDDVNPLAGRDAPNTVWTGDRLVVWGGVGTSTASTQLPATGAIWAPPAR